MTDLTAKVAIIGGGATGLSTAYELSQLGISDVVVLEQAYVASGSSGRSAGVVETQYVDPLDIALRVISRRTFDRFETEHGLHFTHNGYLRIGHTENDARAFEGSVEIQRELGVTDCLVLSGREIQDLFPDVRGDDVTAGLYGPSDGFIDGHLYATLLAELAQAAGVNVLQRSPLTSAHILPDGRHELKTPKGTVTCEFVVNAAGAWAEQVGAHLRTVTPVLPQRHQVISIHLPRTLAYMMPEVMDYSPADGDDGLYFRHETFDQFLGGLHTEEAIIDPADPDDFFEGIDDEFRERMAELLPHRLPGLDDAGLGKGWAGLYPISPDGRPQIGPCHEDRSVIAACGVGGAGLQIAPIVGRLAAEWIAFDEPRSLTEAQSLVPGRMSLISE
jgi:sarcosine oxidase subunit beta